jgi:hypothetical protein
MHSNKYLIFFTLKGVLSIINPQNKVDTPPITEHTDPIVERNKLSIGFSNASPNCFYLIVNK